MSLAQMSQHEFGNLIEGHRREIQAHCYRMTGTTQDAEDMVQETFLRAWQHRDTFTQDVSLRAWLYKIATNVCLDMLKKQHRRLIPMTLGDVSSADEAIPSAILDPIWLDPYPDELLADSEGSLEQQLLTRESVSIAFLAALQLLPPRQRAVVILSDVLEWRNAEISDLLQTTVAAVKSALHRARVTLSEQYPKHSEVTSELHAVVTSGQLEDYVRAWETADIDGLVRMLCDDATFSMPPIPSWYRGRDSIRALVARTIFAGPAQGRWRLLLTRANGQNAFGLYRQSEAGMHEAYGIQVVAFAGSQIADIITFRRPGLVPYFNLPASV